MITSSFQKRYAKPEGSPLKPQNRAALKEWAVICEALARGMQSILIRKGGIQERAGQFSIEHTEFFLFPTTTHQTEEDLTVEGRGVLRSLAARKAQGGRVRLSEYGVLEEAYWLREKELLNKIVPFHMWSPAALESRFGWGHEQGVFVFLLRVFNFSEPLLLPYRDSYAGCTSWVELEQSCSTAGAAPVLPDRNFNVIQRCLRDLLGEPL